MPLSTRLLGDRLADFLGRRHVAAGLQLQCQRGGRNQRLALLVVDHLRINVVQRAVHIQPRPLRGARKLLADARVNALPNFVSLVCVIICRLFLSAEPPCGPVRLLISSAVSSVSVQSSSAQLNY